MVFKMSLFQVKMRVFLLLLLLFQTAFAGNHTLKYIFYSLSGVSDLPEFATVGLVDEVQAFYYNSSTWRCKPKQEWMEKASEKDPKFWQEQIDDVKRLQQEFKANIKTVKKNLNQTEGIHIFQWIFGCDWNDETTEVKGHERIGYDGEDLISYDLKTQKWNISSSLIIQKTWDYDKDLIAQGKHYLTELCPEWLKKYLNFGRSSVMRTELPSVSLLQQTPSSPVRCFASGFYPERASLFWRKDGEELHEEHGEILTNTDGTFQMSVDLKVSSPEDWRRYECVFQLSGVKDDIVTKLDKTAIRTNWEKPNYTTAIIAAVATITLTIIITALIIVIAALIIVKNKMNTRREFINMEVLRTSLELVRRAEYIKTEVSSTSFEP